MLLRTAKAILFLFLLIPATIAASTHAPDARLIALVPPESEIIAGMRTTSSGDWVGGLLVVTLHNRLDLEDFTAITGADPSRMIHEAVFLASTSTRGDLLNIVFSSEDISMRMRSSHPPGAAALQRGLSRPGGSGSAGARARAEHV